MTQEDLDALAYQVARDALGYPVPDDIVVYALATYEGYMTETLADLLAAKTAEFEKAPRRGRSRLAGEIEELKIVLAVRAAVPAWGIFGEVKINTHRWPTRDAPTLSVSLDCLANILTRELAVNDPKKVAELMASLCRSAEPTVGGDPYLAGGEAARYEIEAGIYEADDDEDIP